MKNIFLVLSTLVTLIAVVPYLRGILRHKTKPNIVSWITWTLLTGIATAAEINAHEYRTAIFTAAAVIETGAVVVLGLRHGYVKYTRFDIVCQISAIIGIILWQLFNSPLIGIIASVTIDLIGALPTLRHSWAKPREETWETFALSGVGGFLAIFGLTAHNPASLAYPIYIVIINTVTPAIILYRLARL